MHDFHAILGATAFALLHSLWEVSALGLLAAISFALMRHAAPWQRHAAGLAWMLAMFAAPLLTWIGTLQQWPALAGKMGGMDNMLPNANLANLANLARLASPAALVAVPSWTDWVLPGLTCLWLLGVLAMLALRWGGWLFLRTIDSAGGAALPAQWTIRIEQLRMAFGIGRAVTVRVGTQFGTHVGTRVGTPIATPFTAYALRPVIWLPPGLLTRLPADQLTALLAHELAHVRRLDWVWNLLQHGVESVLFYHPAMWWLSQRVRAERELACDALAARVGGDPVVLAEALLNLQRAHPRRASVGLALGAHAGALQGRVAHLLGDPRAPASARHGAATALLCIAVVLCGTLGATVRVPHALLINMQVQESMAGPLSAGHYRVFRASYLFDGQRDYRLAIDPRGRRDEQYREDGVTKPVDSQVRAWVAAMSAMHGGAARQAPGA